VKGWLLGRLGLAQDVEAPLMREIERAGLSDSFHLLGPTTDIHSVYEQIDVLAFPSHFDAPGRPVFEAAFSGVPSIVAVRDPRPDTIIDGETGLAIPGQDPTKLAAAILHFADRPGEVERMGENARRLAHQNFSPRTNAHKLLAVYSRLVAESRRLTTS
jgi:glycosyltransferase involved in cell wall biosynthesis